MRCFATEYIMYVLILAFYLHWCEMNVYVYDILAY